MYLSVSKFRFLQFRLLLSQVAIYLQFIVTNCLILTANYMGKFHNVQALRAYEGCCPLINTSLFTLNCYLVLHVLILMLLNAIILVLLYTCCCPLPNTYSFMLNYYLLPKRSSKRWSIEVTLVFQESLLMNWEKIQTLAQRITRRNYAIAAVKRGKPFIYGTISVWFQF